MSLHNFFDKLARSRLKDEGQTLFVPTYGYMLGWGTTVGNSLQNWAPGALFLDLDAAAGSRFLINEGSAITASWKTLSALDAANTWAALQTFTLGAAITSADLLTVGGIIVPQHLELVFRVSLHASTVIYNIFNAPRAYTVTNISYTTNVAQVITATVVKSTVNATPASGTTPMHTANAISANTTIHNGTIVALTATGADLVLAATDKIGLVLNSALTSGDFTVNISLKRS